MIWGQSLECSSSMCLQEIEWCSMVYVAMFTMFSDSFCSIVWLIGSQQGASNDTFYSRDEFEEGRNQPGYTAMHKCLWGKVLCIGYPDVSLLGCMADSRMDNGWTATIVKTMMDAPDTIDLLRTHTAALVLGWRTFIDWIQEGFYNMLLKDVYQDISLLYGSSLI